MPKRIQRRQTRGWRMPGGAIEAGEEHIIIDSPADAWLADIDPGPRKILAHRYPDVPKTR